MFGTCGWLGYCSNVWRRGCLALAGGLVIVVTCGAVNVWHLRGGLVIVVTCGAVDVWHLRVAWLL